MPGRQITKHQTVNSHSNTASTLDPNAAIVTGVVTILFPIVLVLGIATRKQHRQRVMKQRIAKLERAWQLMPPQNTH